MTLAEIEAVLRAAFGECDAEGHTLNVRQKQILSRAMLRMSSSSINNSTEQLVETQEVRSSETALPLETAISSVESALTNPLDELASDQRYALLQFIKEQRLQDRSWKSQLLDDWLQEKDSEVLRFVRERYGIQWLDRVQPIHVAQYADQVTMVLQVGDRIEVSNGLWEWVQEEGPCSQEWFSCTVVNLTEINLTETDLTETDLTETGAGQLSDYDHYTICTIRFGNGMEYQIQGIYEWNRYRWRWAQAEV